MKLLELKENIATFWIKDSKEIILKKGEIVINNNVVIKNNDLISWTSYINFFQDFILIQKVKFGEIYVYTFSGELIKKIEEGFNLDIKTINNIHYIANRNTKTYWIIDDDLNLTNTGKYIQFNAVLNNNIIHYTSTFIKCYKNLDGDLKWEIQVADFGRNIAKHPKTGEILWDKPNEIKEALLADDKNIYVPLTGGQLLALDSQTGEKVWMFDNEKLGMYNIFQDKIYKGDGKSIIALNAKNGQIEKELYFKNIPILREYIPAGPFLAYEDIIISTDVLYGKICMINRHTFEVEEFFSLNKKLVNSKSAIAWNNNRLYVLDIDRTLHIFEKEENV